MKSISFIIAGALALCLAAISATYWFEELAGRPDWQIVVAVAASVFVSVMTPICAYFIRSHGYVLIASVVIFFAADTYQNAQGWQTFKGLTISDEVIAAQQRVATAQTALDELPTPSATGAIRQASTWETVNTSLTERLEKAEQQLADLQEPEAPFEHVAAVMGLIQIALSIFFACLGQRKEPATPTAPAVETNGEQEETAKVIRFSHRPKPMDAKDLKAWNAISK
ncbi:MAG: hypothetical protein AAFU81_12240 [Pseudomonadota bacterium]